MFGDELVISGSICKTRLHFIRQTDPSYALKSPSHRRYLVEHGLLSPSKHEYHDHRAKGQGSGNDASHHNDTARFRRHWINRFGSIGHIGYPSVLAIAHAQPTAAVVQVVLRAHGRIDAFCPIAVVRVAEAALHRYLDLV